MLTLQKFKFFFIELFYKIINFLKLDQNLIILNLALISNVVLLIAFIKYSSLKQPPGTLI